jgi:WD40 repeat protein
MHHLSPLRALEFQRNGRYLASGCARGDVAVWMLAESKAPVSVSTLRSTITHLAWSPKDRRLAAAAENGAVVVFDVE